MSMDSLHDLSLELSAIAAEAREEASLVEESASFIDRIDFLMRSEYEVGEWPAYITCEIELLKSRVNTVLSRVENLRLEAVRENLLQEPLDS